MPILNTAAFNAQTGITSSTAAADRTVMLRPDLPVSIKLDLTAGTPSTGANIQVTNAPYEQIQAGTATWVTPVGIANTLVDFMTVSTSSAGCQFTGVRAVVTDGTWTLNVRQG